MAEYTLKDGRRLVLRDPVKEDASTMLAYARTVGGETDFLLIDENGLGDLTLEGEEEWIRSTLAAPNTKMFLGFVEGELVLLCDVRACNSRARIAHNAVVAISVKRDYWRLGIGSVAMRSMIDFAKGTGALRTLSLEVREGNERAISLYKRFGFQEIGRHKGRIQIRGSYYDEILMDLDLTAAQ